MCIVLKKGRTMNMNKLTRFGLIVIAVLAINSSTINASTGEVIETKDQRTPIFDVSSKDQRTPTFDDSSKVSFPALYRSIQNAIRGSESDPIIFGYINMIEKQHGVPGLLVLYDKLAAIKDSSEARHALPQIARKLRAHGVQPKTDITPGAMKKLM